MDFCLEQEIERTKNMKATYDDIRKQFAHNPFVIKNLEAFIKAKEKYIETESIKDRIDLKTAYVEIYEDIKGAFYCHAFSEEVFLAYKECLQNFE